MDGDLAELLLPIGVLGTIAAGIGYFIKTLTDYRLKKKLIEKGLVNSDAAELFKDQVDSKYGSLKWGLIILFGGLGLILLHSIEYYRDSPLPFGVFAVSVSLGFLIYFAIANRMSKN